MNNQPQKRVVFDFLLQNKSKKLQQEKQKKQNKTDFVVKQIKIMLMTSEIKTPVVLL